MKIILLITGLGMGGAERQVLDLADRFVQKQHQVKIIYMTGDAFLTPKNPQIEVNSIHMHKTPIGLIKSICKFRKIIQDFKPNIVHSHMFHANILARITRLFTQIPRLICTAHSTNEGGRLRMLLYHYTDFLADISTNVSKEAVDIFIQKKATTKNKIIPVYNGLDIQKFQVNSKARDHLRHFFRITDDTIILLAVGRLTAAKDYPNLLYALQQVVKNHQNIKLYIAGDGSEKKVLLELISELNLTNYVEFLGIRNDIPDLMNMADIYVMSSAWEGFGLVIAEAMLTEKICIATNCGGISEVMGSFGYLVPIKNTTQLAGKIKTVINLPNSEKIKIGKNARQHILNNFNLDIIAQQWLDLYQNNKV